MMTNSRKTATLFLALLLVFGLSGISFAVKENVDPAPSSIAPLFQRPGPGDGVIKDLNDYPEEGRIAPPRQNWPQRQVPASLILSEGFESAVPPAGWTSVVNNAYTWFQTTASSYTGIASAQCDYDEDYTGTQDEWLVSPVMDFTGSSAADLKLNFAFLMSYYWGVDPYDNYNLEVWISTDGGANFTTQLWGEEDFGLFTNWTWYEIEIPLTAYATETNVAFGFRYTGYDGAQGNFDNISITDDPAPVGRCCYGPDPFAPLCDDVTELDCAALGGVWDETLSCVTDPCPIPTAGDDCSAPYAIDLSVLPVTVAGETNCGRVDDYDATCLGYYDSGEDMLFELVVTANVDIDLTLDPKGTTWSSMLIDDACPPDPTTCLGTVSSSSGTEKKIIGVSLTPGTYYVMVDTWSTPDCIPDFDLTIEESAGGPVNDNCVDAIAVGDVVDLPFTTIGANSDGGNSYITSPNVWYVYTATCTGNATISLCGSSYDTKIAVYDGASCAPLGTQIATNDDACSLQSEVQISVIAGNQYLIEVGGYSANFGDGILNISCVIPPPNDNCEDVTPEYPPFTHNGNNVGASNQCSSFPGNHVWEAFTIDTAASVTLSYAGTSPAFGNAWLNLAMDCPCTDFTYGGDFYVGGDGNVVITWPCLQPGTYYYPVLEEPGASGDYTITVTATYFPEGCYCYASGGCDEYISRVELGAIDNASACDGYYDYTALSTSMYLGLDYALTVTNGNGYSSDQCGVWVDWNGDKDFDDPGETITVTGVPGYGPYTATITPPYDAVLGDTRMRVRITYTGAVEPCDGTTYGEVEDYTLVLDDYTCGDANGDDVLDMSDVTFMINYLFNLGPAPVPLIAGDCTCNATTDIADLVYLAYHLFHGGNPPCCPF